MNRSLHKRSFSPLSVIFPLLFSLLLFGCALPKSTSDEIVKGYAKAAGTKGLEQDKINRLNEQLFASANVNVDPSDYLLGAGDLIEVSIFEAEELNTTARVSARGFITLPLLEEVKVKGLTAHLAEAFIENLYKEKYIKDPHVSIFVKEHFSQRITIVGQVKNPGTYDYMGRQRLLDVLALAGGLTEKAGPFVQIRRHADAKNQKSMYMVDLEKLIKEGSTELNLTINGGDVIFVSEAGTFFVDGAVRRPGSYPLKSKTNLQEAVLAAGGMAPYAVEDEMTIIRTKKNGEREIIKIDLAKDPEANRMRVQDHDVIVVKDSAWGKLVHGSGFNIGFPGIMSFGYRDPSQ
jgi:polysaccharide export outer membrane protein